MNIDPQILLEIISDKWVSPNEREAAFKYCPISQPYIRKWVKSLNHGPYY